MQAQQIIKATDVHPLGYPTVEALVRMGNKLEKATNGKYKIQMFPSMQLGGEKEMIEQAQVGALQIARISVGPMGPIVDELNVFNMPFVFSDEAHMRKVIDGPIGAEMLDKLTNSSARLVALGWMDAGTRNVYSDKPVTKPADLKGMKIRMMGNPLFVETMNAMGGNGIAMGFNELHQALQSGVVDGAENNEPTLFAQNHYQTPQGQGLQPDRPPDHPRDLRLLEGELGQAAQGRPGPDHEALARGADGAAQAVGRVRRRGRRQAEGRRHQVRAGRQGSLLQGDAAGARQVRRQVRRPDPAHPGHQVASRPEERAAEVKAQAALFLP